MTVREFQGRGLTHSHGLFIMKPQDTPSNEQEVDKIIWAFYPDPEEFPELFNLVRTLMVHGPCDDSSDCHKKQGKCKHGFPFEFRDYTDITGKRPLYRRPNDGRGFYKNFKGKLISMDNRWVVPYNPVILLRYRGHVNIMYSPSTSACKYFYGYLLKGSYGNRVNVSIVQKNQNRPPGEPYDHDEVKEFKEMKHMGAYEAHYYIMAYSQAHMYPTVQVLPVYEEFKQTIIYVEGQEEVALERHEGSKLTAWFELNQRRGIHRGKLYTDVVKYYKYENNIWRPSNTHTIGRLSPLAATAFNSEPYHLRLLLCNRTDVTSFQDLRTVNGVVHETYKGSCAALNLIEDEGEIRLLMDELAFEQFPRLFRKTFAILLSNVNPINPGALWDEYKERLAEDYLHQIDDDEDLAFQLALRDILEVLQEFGKSLEDYNLPALDGIILTRHNRVIEDEPQQGALTMNEADALVAQLNEDQRTFFNAVINSVENRSNEKYFFLTGPGGTGKTFTYNLLIDYLLSRGR